MASISFEVRSCNIRAYCIYKTVQYLLRHRLEIYINISAKYRHNNTLHVVRVYHILHILILHLSVCDVRAGGHGKPFDPS